MRGVLSAGSLLGVDLLEFRDYFDAVYAVSAGSVNAAYFLSGQGIEGITVYFDDISSRRFIFCYTGSIEKYNWKPTVSSMPTLDFSWNSLPAVDIVTPYYAPGNYYSLVQGYGPLYHASWFTEPNSPNDDTGIFQPASFAAYSTAVNNWKRYENSPSDFGSATGAYDFSIIHTQILGNGNSTPGYWTSAFGDELREAPG